jgi:hypothetical protein
MRKALGCNRQETRIGRDTHDRLRNTERYDLRVGHASPGVLRSRRQEIVSGAEHRYQQQVEVGKHRGPLGTTARTSTADFDPLRHASPTHDRSTTAVALLI